MEADRTDRSRLVRELSIAWIHLAVLWAFAFAKPLFDVVADSPEFFVARGNTRGDILIFAIATVLVPPTLLVLVEALLVRLPRARSVVHLVFIGALVAAFAVQLLDDALGGSGALLIALALLVGALAAVGYARTSAVPAVLSVLAPLPIVFLLLFLLGSGVSKLVLPQGDVRAADAAIDSTTPVVFLIFDEFDANLLMDRRQRIDATRYPNLAALARDATWYPNATTVNSQTTLAVPALLSGRRPTPDLLPIAADYPNNIFTLLADSHEIHATETATQVCPERLCGKREREPLAKRLRSLAKDLGIVSAHLVTPERMESDLPAVDRTFGNFGGGGRDTAKAAVQPDVPLSALSNRSAQFAGLFGQIGPQGDRPGLFFLHTALPHIPWQYLPGGQQYVNGGPDFPGLEDEVWAKDAFTWRLGLQRHLLQAAFADRMAGRLLARLRAAHVYDRALIVVTADHGVSFRPGEPRRRPSPGNFSDIASVPLLIKYPDRPDGRVDESFVRTIDVVPTIAAELGQQRLPWSAEGRPIGDGGPATGTVAVRAGGGEVTRVPFDRFVRQHKAGLRRMLSLFRAGEGTGPLYGNGDAAGLLGAPAGGLAKAPPVSGQLQPDSASVFAAFRPAARIVPSFISGRISGVPAGESLAVAIDGTIRGVTESFATDDGVRMAGIVPASSFRAGRNSVQVFVVRGDGAGRQLAPLETRRPQSYRLVEDGDNLAIRRGGREIPVSKGAMQGFVDAFARDDSGTRIGGWAVSRDEGAPAEQILVFAHGRLVAQGKPTLDRPDVRANLGDSAAASGFQLPTPVTGADQGDFRVFAVSGDRAGELPRYGG